MSEELRPRKWLNYLRPDEVKDVPERSVCDDDPLGFFKFDRYREGKSSLHLHVWISEEPGNFCAIFKRAISDGNIDDTAIASTDTIDQGHARYIKLPMLVPVGELIENGQRIGVPSTVETRLVVRLQPLDNCLRAFRNSYETFRALSLVNTGIGEDGELDFPSNLLDGRTASQVEGDVIQGTPEVVQGITNDQSEMFRRSVFESGLDDKLVGVRFYLGVQSIRLRLEELANVAFERLDVLLCPTKLELCGVEDDENWRRSGQESAQTEDAEGARDTDPQAVGLHARPQEGCEAEEAVSHSSPPHAL